MVHLDTVVFPETHRNRFIPTAEYHAMRSDTRLFSFWPFVVALLIVGRLVGESGPVEAAEPKNLALGATATSPDELESDGAASGDQAAIDGRPDTYWDEADNQALYRLRLEFPAETAVAVLRITGYQQHVFAPKDFDVVCDDRVVKSVRDAKYANNKLRVHFEKTVCRSLELKITGYYGASPAVRELEVYETAEGLPIEVVQSDSPQGPGYQWYRTADSLALYHDGKPVWQSNHRAGEGKPCLHPVGSIDGVPLTEFRPADHPWHRGIWLTWKYINGLCYWDEGKDGLSPGRTEVLQVKANLGADGSARIKLDIYFHPPGETPVMIEQRTIDFGPPQTDGSYRIDWRSKFVALEDLLLERTPIPGQPGGVRHGGYAGFSARMAKTTHGWKVRSSDANAEQAEHGKPARWLHAGGPTSDGKTAGLAIFDHPKNTRHPSPWYVEPGMPYFSPAILFNEPLKIPAGESLELRYRLLIHAGELDREKIEKEWREFSK